MLLTGYAVRRLHRRQRIIALQTVQDRRRQQAANTTDNVPKQRDRRAT